MNIVKKKYIIILFLLSSLVSCQSQDKSIIGKWKLVKSDFYPLGPYDIDGSKEYEYSKNGQCKTLHNGKRTGIGTFEYRIIKDSIFITHYDGTPDKKNDYPGVGFKVINDSLLIGTDKQNNIYIRSSY